MGPPHTHAQLPRQADVSQAEQERQGALAELAEAQAAAARVAEQRDAAERALDASRGDNMELVAALQEAER